MFLRLPAQEHAVFLGLPLGGSVEEIEEELQDKGYEVRIRSQNIISLTGMFDGITPVGKHSTNGRHLTRAYHSARSVSRGRASRLCSYGGKIAKGGRGPKPRDYDACRKLEGYFLRNCSFFCNFAFGTKQ